MKKFVKVSDYEPVLFKPGEPISFIKREYPNIKYIAIIDKKIMI